MAPASAAPAVPTASAAQSSARRPRPPFLRALGRREPPLQIQVRGQRYTQVRPFKHDSWAATVLYQRAAAESASVGATTAAEPALLLVCKFNRQASVFGLPLRWLGTLLARREGWFLERLAASGRVPAVHRLVCDSEGQSLPYAVAHDYVPGEPLSRRSQLSDAFFPALERLLAELHGQGLAYVDLHKMENVLVGPDGLPWLIDFQVSFALPVRQPLRRLLQPVLGLLRSGDQYHLMKHWIRLRPDQCGLGPEDLDRFRPRWIRWHRRLGVPLRRLRRQLLVLLGVRGPSGHAHSEQFAEEALRDRGRG